MRKESLQGKVQKKATPSKHFSSAAIIDAVHNPYGGSVSPLLNPEGRGTADASGRKVDTRHPDIDKHDPNER